MTHKIDAENSYGKICNLRESNHVEVKKKCTENKSRSGDKSEKEVEDSRGK